LPPLPSTGDQTVFEFQVGFSTTEIFGPGQILDSFTLYLQDAALTQAAVLVTLDASGATWAPVTPGGLVVPNDSLLSTPTVWDGPIPALPTTYAYDVAYTLPEALRQQPLRVTLSLFDNLSPLQSSGYFRTALVPEPATVWLLIFPLVLFALRPKSRR